jgi:hypothetical protein
MFELSGNQDMASPFTELAIRNGRTPDGTLVELLKYERDTSRCSMWHTERTKE